MSKFNTATENSMKTVNKEGFAAYDMHDKDKLISQVLTSFFNESKFYGDNSKELVETLTKVIKSDPEFVMRLAIFARREFNMRSVSHVLVSYLANIPEGKPFAKEAVEKCVLRGDDATEILAFYLSTFGKPIPNSLRKGLKTAFQNFNAYTLAKYKGDGHAVKMRDILCLCRPSPVYDGQSETWKKLLEGTLEPAYTWETELSAKGNTKEVWEELIDSGKVGYMALLRNLRNIINADPENFTKVLDKLSNSEAVRQSKQLPFRFLSAYRELPDTNWNSLTARSALERAAEIAVENLPKIPGKTIIAIDVSGSMTYGTISQKSKIRCADIAMLLGVMANELCEQALVYTFDDYIRQVHLQKHGGILKTVTEYRCNGGGTDMYLPFEEILNNNLKADRMIILSDNVCNAIIANNIPSWRRPGHSGTVNDLANEYRKTINPNFWVHAIDLEGYGAQQFIGNRTNYISGWSEKVFDFIMLAENGIETLKTRIENYGKWKYWE